MANRMKRSEQLENAVIRKQAEAYQVKEELETLITMLNEARACEAQHQAELDEAAKEAEIDTTEE